MTSVVSVAVLVPSVAVTMYPVPGGVDAGMKTPPVRLPDASVVRVTGSLTGVPPALVTCTETSVFAGQPEPVTGRLVPA